MTYTDPNNVTNPTSTIVVDNQANGSYTGVPQHVIVDGKDFLIVDADSHGIAVYALNATTGALIEPPTYLTWPQRAGEAEQGHFDSFEFYASPDGTKITGFDADSTGVAALSYDIASGTWSAVYDADTEAGGVTTNFADFATFKGSDGNVYAYGAAGSGQDFTKYQWDWTTNTWNSVKTFDGSALGYTNSNDPQTDVEIVTAPDGSQYLVSLTVNGFTQRTHIYELDATTGDISTTGIVIPTWVAASGVTATRIGAFNTGELTTDPSGNLVFSTSGGLHVVNPDNGAILYNDITGGAGAPTFYYGSDVIYGDDGYVYIVGRDGNGSLNTKVYQIDGSGNWSFIANGVDTTSTIDWDGGANLHGNGTYTESSNDVTTLTSGLKMIYSTQESTTGGPNTLIAAQVSTIGEVVPPICFAAGTMIETDRGEIPVELIQVGDLVRTKDNGYKPVLWVGSKVFRLNQSTPSESLHPVRIRAGALGSGLPKKDLYVSQQHRIMVQSKIAQRVTGFDEVLVPAKKMLEIDGIDLVKECDEVTYVHFLFDKHEVVYSNGAETESLFTGPEALKSVGEDAKSEILNLFPELSDMTYQTQSARIIPSGKMTRKLIERHIKNNIVLNK